MFTCMYVYTCVGTRVVKTTPTTDEKMSTKVKIGVMQKFLVTEVTEAGRNIFVQLDTPEAYQVQDLSKSPAVYFADYAGNSETVETSSIYPPTGDYFTLPSQALFCLLGDFVLL